MTKLYPTKQIDVPHRHYGESNTWVVVADHKEAHIYCKNIHRLAIVSTTPNEDALLDGTTTQRTRGHMFHPNVGAVYYCNNPEDRTKKQKDLIFAHKLAQLLDSSEKKKEFNHLVLIAPPVILGKIRPYLTKNVEKCIVAEIDKELTRMPERELYDYLANMLWL